jgi:hypothetical protein
MESKTLMHADAYHQALLVFLGTKPIDAREFDKFERSMGLKYVPTNTGSDYFTFEIFDAHLYLMAKMRYGL